MDDIVIINAELINQILKTEKPNLINLVRETYLNYQERNCLNPDSFFLRFPDHERNRIIGLPASNIKGKNKMSGIKWIASYPDNINVNLPRASASIILNDYNTGRVKAFIEGTAISASRTAASATLATQLLVKDLTTSHHVLFVGCGVISKNIMDFFSVSGISLNMIHLYDINPATAQQFNKYISTQYNLPVSIVKSPQEGFQQANIIVFATTEIIPYISSDDFKLTNLKNKIILGISLRDICPDLIIEANNIVDDVQHCLKANTSIHLTEQLHHHHQFINGTICGLINNTITLSPDKPIIFSPFGMGILDLNVAIYIYKQIQKNKLGVYCAFHE